MGNEYLGLGTPAVATQARGKKHQNETKDQKSGFELRGQQWNWLKKSVKTDRSLKARSKHDPRQVSRVSHMWGWKRLG